MNPFTLESLETFLAQLAQSFHVNKSNIKKSINYICRQVLDPDPPTGVYVFNLWDMHLCYIFKVHQACLWAEDEQIDTVFVSNHVNLQGKYRSIFRAGCSNVENENEAEQLAAFYLCIFTGNKVRGKICTVLLTISSQVIVRIIEAGFCGFSNSIR